MEQILTTGRRKTATARVFLKKGKGSIIVNGRELSNYFPREVAQMLVKQPLESLEITLETRISA